MRAAGRGLLGNSMALLAMSHITAVLGYVFWMVCAHRVSAASIGVSNTVISAMSLVAVLTAAGFVPLLTRALPGANPEERSGLCSTAIVLTAVVSGVGGVLGALLLPAGINAAVGTLWLVGLLGAGAVGTALLLVINAALLGVRRAEFSLLGSVVASVARLAIVTALLDLGLLVADTDSSVAHTILLLWAASLAISFALSLWLLARAAPGFSFRPGLVWLPRLRHGVAWGTHHHSQRAGAWSRNADSGVRVFPRRSGRILLRHVDGQHRLLRGILCRRQRTAGGLRRSPGTDFGPRRGVLFNSSACSSSLQSA